MSRAAVLPADARRTWRRDHCTATTIEIFSLYLFLERVYRLIGLDKVAHGTHAGFTPARSDGLLDGIGWGTLVTDEPQVGVCLSFGPPGKGQHFVKMFARE